MVGDARIAERALLRTSGGGGGAGETLHGAVDVDEARGRIHVAAREHAAGSGAAGNLVAQTGTPHQVRVEHDRALLHVGIEDHDVARRLQGEPLAGHEAIGTFIDERQRRRRRRGVDALRRDVLDRVEFAIEARRLCGVCGGQREGQRLGARIGGYQIHGLARAIRVLLEGPALEPAAAIGEDRAHLLRLDDVFALH